MTVYQTKKGCTQVSVLPFTTFAKPTRERLSDPAAFPPAKKWSGQSIRMEGIPVDLSLHYSNGKARMIASRLDLDLVLLQQLHGTIALSSIIG